MKAIEQYFQVVLFVFDNCAKRNSIFFPSVLNLVLLGVKGLTPDLKERVRRKSALYQHVLENHFEVRSSVVFLLTPIRTVMSMRL